MRSITSEGFLVHKYLAGMIVREEVIATAQQARANGVTSQQLTFRV